jgi:hypothetical protein
MPCDRGVFGPRSAIHPRRIAKSIRDAILNNRRVREKPRRESAELGLALNSRFVLAALVVVILFR